MDPKKLRQQVENLEAMAELILKDCQKIKDELGPAKKKVSKYTPFIGQIRAQRLRFLKIEK